VTLYLEEKMMNEVDSMLGFLELMVEGMVLELNGPSKK
jgi:hypothetical protein